jgi:DNA polymerase-3 subunit epsilon
VAPRVGLQRSFDDLGAPLFSVPFCVLDLETTGGSAADCEITEIGAVKYLGGQLTGTFHTLVNPGTPIPPFITVLTGITEIMVVEAPKIAEALPAFLEFIGESVIVGHNVRFDLSFLNAAAERLGYGRLPHRSTDTHRLARRLVPREVRNLKLSTLAAHFRSPITPTHRALDDAKATAHVFWELLSRAGDLGVSHLEDLMELPTARGSTHYAKIELSETLPRRPGVYLFRDRDGTVFYVGKAKNLRTRVRSYFYGDTRKSVETMLRELDTIEHRVCTTELEAEVTELRLIHAHRPRHNRRSRPAKSPHWIRLTRERFPRLSMVRKPYEDGTLLLGPFRNRRGAERVVMALWDAVPIRRCRTVNGKRSAACSFAQLGVAVCPCDGSIEEAAYGAIVTELRNSVQQRPQLLLDRLSRKMRDYAGAERFEDAAAVRDRYRALAASLNQRRTWQALQAAGAVWLEDDAGDGAIMENGKLVAAWNQSQSAPLFRISEPEEAPPSLPPSPGAAEEAWLLWRWLARPEVRIVDGYGGLALPVQPVRKLEEVA